MKILLADDETEFVSAIGSMLEAEGHEVLAVTAGGIDVLAAYDEFKPDVVILDVVMPRFNGITVSQTIRERDPDARIILCSGRLAPEHPLLASAHATKFLAKPLSIAALMRALDEVAPS